MSKFRPADHSNIQIVDVKIIYLCVGFASVEDPEPGSSVVLIAVLCSCILLVVIVIAAVCLLKRRKFNRLLSHRERLDDPETVPMMGMYYPMFQLTYDTLS